MLLHRIYRHVAALILSSSCVTVLHAQESWDVTTVIAPSQTIEATRTEITPTLGSPPATLEFGAAMAIHGHTVLAGMPAFGGDIGRVAIFGRDRSGNWIRQGTLDPADGQAGDRFGDRLAIWGDEALVGSMRGVYVYHERDGHWQQVQKLPSTGEAPSNEGLALGERWAFIGSSVPGKSGEVRVYDIGRHGSLREVKVLDSRTGVPDDGFGARIAVSHGMLLVGAPQDNSGQGAAYVFESFGSHWLQRQKLIAIGGRAGESFGSSVAIDDRVIVVGAPFADRDPDQFLCQVGYSGVVYVFEPHHGLFFEQQKLLGPPKCTEEYGSEVAVDRGFLVTRTPSAFPVYAGSTFIYQRQGRRFVPSASEGNSDVGPGPVALSDSVLFTGQPDDRGFLTGFAYFSDLTQLPDAQ